MFRIFPLLIFFFTTGFAQSYTSTIRGSVRDADTGLPLVGATVALAPAQTGTITDPQGTFRFENLNMGRYQLTVSYVGYQTVFVSELLLESGKENVQQIRMFPAGKELREATVTATRPASFNSIQEITIEQTLRYAATYMDPARVATSFPGVAAANDQANGLVIRGNSPNTMQWRLEGVEIVNPNHLSNAGTFSDRPTSTGGGVNILSTQLLGNSSFLSGAFPAQYGNVTGGVLDMNLRNGNDEKREFTAQASLLGLDFAAEGPFSKKSKASYLVNYRYSFTGLLGAMGVSFGGEDIRFQDLSFHINLPTDKAGTFSLFGMGGISSNRFEGETDSTAWETQKDGQNIFYKNKMGALGLTHTLPLSSKSSLRTVFAASGLNAWREASLLYPEKTNPYNPEISAGNKQDLLSASSVYTHRFNARSRFKAGAYLTFQHDVLNSFTATESDYKVTMIRPFGSWTYNPVPAVTTEVGLHGFYNTLKPDRRKPEMLVEPRAAIKWQAGTNTQINVSYGLHSQLQPASIYAQRVTDGEFYDNADLTPTRAHHFVLGVQQNLGKSSSLKIEAYYQKLFDVPVGNDLRDNFSAINLLEERALVRLYNRGTGRNYGLESSFQKLLTHDFYMLISGSLYDATYVDYEGVRRDSRFNGRHTFSLTGGKELKSGDQSLWGINAKVLWLGGFREKPIDEAYSSKLGYTLYETQSSFSVRVKDYFRPDLRIYWKKSNAKYNRTLALDLQNVSGTKNEAYRYFDSWKDRVVTQYQLGLIPVLSYRWEFY